MSVSRCNAITHSKHQSVHLMKGGFATTIHHRFSKEVFHSRIKLGMTQEQAAEALSISVRWFQYIESGKRMPGAVLTLQIIALFGINGEDLREKK